MVCNQPFHHFQLIAATEEAPPQLPKQPMESMPRVTLALLQVTDKTTSLTEKRHRKAHAGFEELSAHSISETGASWGLHVTSHGSRWGSLQGRKEPSWFQRHTATQNQGEGREPRGPWSRMAAGWPSLKWYPGIDGANTCHVPEHHPGPAHQ